MKKDLPRNVPAGRRGTAVFSYARPAMTSQATLSTVPELLVAADALKYRQSFDVGCGGACILQARLPELGSSARQDDAVESGDIVVTEDTRPSDSLRRRTKAAKTQQTAAHPPPAVLLRSALPATALPRHAPAPHSAASAEGDPKRPVRAARAAFIPSTDIAF